MMNLTAPIQPNTATIENQMAIAMFSNSTGNLSFVFDGILPAFICAKTGNTKSNGVKPIAPQIETKSPKKGMAEATNVTSPM